MPVGDVAEPSAVVKSTDAGAPTSARDFACIATRVLTVSRPLAQDADSHIPSTYIQHPTRLSSQTEPVERALLSFTEYAVESNEKALMAATWLPSRQIITSKAARIQWGRMAIAKFWQNVLTVAEF